jgi:4-amino-4-deoxy-L-arabinose transferase-like glycosyltransferase
MQTPDITLATPNRPPFLDRLTERQLAIFVILFGALLFIPFAGSYGLWDPWETHYGEVGREMARGGDFISLYWSGSPLDTEHFWSKPVLTFWLIALSLKVFGLGGAGLPAGEFALSTRTEWAMRLPFALMAILALVGIFLPVSRFVGRRAGILSVVALATFPLFSLVARQAMTDMAFIGPMTLGLGLLAMALFDDRDELLPRKTWRRFSFPHHSLFYATVGLLVMTVVPQLIVDSIQLRWALPTKTPRHIPGIVLMLPWIAGFFVFLRFAAKARYKAPLYLYLAAMLCGLALLAKGLAGLGLPTIVFLAYLAFTWNWKRMARADLVRSLPIAVLACALVAVPWHQAMLLRHGFPFWNELYGDNHWRRLVTGRHGDRGSFEYFLRELGYGLFPWIALAPAAFAWVVMRPFRSNTGAPDLDDATKKRRDMLWFGAIWFVAGYALVSLSMTKFHHYILPGLPGLAIALGCFLDDILKEKRQRLALLAALIGLPLLGLVVYDLTSAQKSPQRFLWLFSYDYINTPQGRNWPPELNYLFPIRLFAGLFAAGTLLLALRKWRIQVATALCLVAVAWTYFLLDVFMKQTSDRWSQKQLIASYYKQRQSPEERLIAWQLYWRGENFYTQNEIYEGPTANRTVFLGDKNAENLQGYLNRNLGKRMFFVVEQTRWDHLRSLIPEASRGSLQIVDKSNNKFYLGMVSLQGPSTPPGEKKTQDSIR